jgi:hypothetical protein
MGARHLYTRKFFLEIQAKMNIRFGLTLAGYSDSLSSPPRFAATQAASDRFEIETPEYYVPIKSAENIVQPHLNRQGSDGVFEECAGVSRSRSTQALEPPNI